MSTVQLTETGRIATLVIDRPDKLNALSSDVLDELLDVFGALDARSSEQRPRAVVLTGKGERAFVAGADIGELSQLSPTEALRLSEAGQRLGRVMEEAQFPSVAAVNGVALGGGCELALCTDFIIASESARFGQPEVKLGLIPGFGGTFRLAERVGIGWARRLIYTGEILDAARAAELGLVDVVVPAGQLLQTAHALAEQIAERAPLAVAAAKRSLLRAQGIDRARAADHETLAFSALFASADARDGLAAFLLKRAPEFSGR